MAGERHLRGILRGAVLARVRPVRRVPQSNVKFVSEMGVYKKNERGHMFYLKFLVIFSRILDILNVKT